MPAGHHTVVWNGTDTNGNTVASGLYFCQVSFGDQVPITKKLVKAQ